MNRSASSMVENPDLSPSRRRPASDQHSQQLAASSEVHREDARIASNVDSPVQSVVKKLGEVKLVCPRCKSSLTAARDVFHCRVCDSDYPVVHGIPDFRVFEDPFLSFEEDHQRAEWVAGQLGSVDLPELLTRYWERSDTTPDTLKPKFVRNALLAENRGRRLLHTLTDSTIGKTTDRRRLLEIGSGTGGLLQVALQNQDYRQVVGIDIAMRWLQVSQQRFLDAGIEPPPLICCCAEHLPFPDGSFDATVASSVLEFCRDSRLFFKETRRTLSDRGGLLLNTVNRYSLARDPYAYLWGVGLLPRAWQASYVRWRKNGAYEHIRLHSLGELRRLAYRYGRMEVLLPDVDDRSLREFSPWVQQQVRLYRTLKRLPGFRQFLTHCGPAWDLLLHK